MKLIDLLNKINNGEDVPKEIIFEKENYKWNRQDHFYEKYNGDDLLELCTLYRTDELLNTEVELITDIELIEDEIDIDNIEEYKQEYTERFIDVDIRHKINEILQGVKQINKRVKKLEEK